MSELLQTLLTFVLLYKYAAIFVLTFFAAIAFPIPSGAIASAAFFFATQGYLNAPLVGLASVLGNISGDLLTFWFTRRYGVKVVRKIGLGRVLESEAVHKLEARIARHPVATVFISRLTVSLTPLVNVLAGFTTMPFRVFAITAIIGEIAEIGVNYVYGVLLGNQLVYISQLVGLSGLILIVGIALLSVLLWRRVRRRRARHATSEMLK